MRPGEPMRLLLFAAAMLAAVATTTGAASAPAATDGAGAGTAAAEGAPAAPHARSFDRTSPLAAPLELAIHGPASPAPAPDGPLTADASAVLTGADRWHAAGFSGRGVRVAVIDAGFSGYEQAFAADPGVHARSFRADGSIAGSSGHGLRAARIVRALAPGADLLLLVFSSTPELSAAVDYAIEADADVISFSIGFVHNGPGDGSGPVNEIAGRAAEAGILWSAAAGNWARQHWAGPFRDDDGDGVHEFGDGEPLNGRDYHAGDLISASLRWDDEWGAACSDFDLELVGPGGSLVRASRGVQDCDDDPVEGLRVLATEDGRYSARIVAAPDAPANTVAARTLSLLMLGSPDRGAELRWFERAGSLSQPADHPSVLTVGALDGAGEVAPYSSHGPTSDGRAKPELLAPAGLARVGAEGAEGPARAGTSDAAPLVAGAAALLREALPALSPGALIAELRERARPLAAPGTNAAQPASMQPASVQPGVVQLGSLEGLGPLLPEGGREATLTGERPAGDEFALFAYAGPDGYPTRFLHLLLDDPQPRIIWRYDAGEADWHVFIPGAPAWVNRIHTFSDGDLLWVQFQAPHTE